MPEQIHFTAGVVFAKSMALLASCNLYAAELIIQLFDGALDSNAPIFAQKALPERVGATTRADDFNKAKNTHSNRRTKPWHSDYLYQPPISYICCIRHGGMGDG
jgi:hypothetical protein